MNRAQVLAKIASMMGNTCRIHTSHERLGWVIKTNIADCNMWVLFVGKSALDVLIGWVVKSAEIISKALSNCDIAVVAPGR